MIARTEVVLDASALLAFVNRERGVEIVARRLSGAVISSVNWSEVLQKSLARGTDIRGLPEAVYSLGASVVPFTADDAHTAAELWERGRRWGLSLADRACLALAVSMQRPVLTADRAWLELRGLGVAIESIR